MSESSNLHKRICPQTMAYGGLKSMSDPLYRQFARLAAQARVSPQRLAVDLVRETWCDAYRCIDAPGRRRIAKTIMMECTHRATGRTN